MITEKKTDDSAAAEPLSRSDILYMLPESTSALARIPKSLHALVMDVAKECYDTDLEKLLKLKKSDPVLGLSSAYSQSMLEHSAKLSVLSVVGHLSFHPWHLADKAKISAITDEIIKTGSFDGVRSHLLGEGTFNLYVASSDSQDIDEYLKGVAKIVKTHQIYYLVLDEDQIDRRRHSDLLDACGAIGWSPAFAGLASKVEARNHPAIQGASKAGVAAKMVWSNGRQFDNPTLQPVEHSQPKAGSSQGLTGKIAEMRARQAKALRPR